MTLLESLLCIMYIPEEKDKTNILMQITASLYLQLKEFRIGCHDISPLEYDIYYTLRHYMIMMI